MFVTPNYHQLPTFKHFMPNSVWFKKSYKGTTRWNSLPADLKNIITTKCFKSVHKRKLLDEELIYYRQ